MTYTEIKEKGSKKYFYRVRSIRKGEKVDKQRIYLGVNLKKHELKEKESEADKKLLNIKEPTIEKIKDKESRESLVKEKITFNIDKNKDFSNWYTEIIQKAELGDLRYNVKGFLVFQPWSVLSMEKMFKYLEQTLQKKRA